MRFKEIGVVILAFAGTAMAQAPSVPQFALRGDRFKPLTWETMAPEQKVFAQHVLAGDRGSLNGPYNVLMRSPEMGDLAQAYGAHTRFHSSLPRRLNEMVILMTARFWVSQYEWYAHKTAALQAGLNPAIVDAISNGKRPATMDADEQTLYNFCSELLQTRQVSDATFAAARDKFTERGVVDLIGVMGYYHLVSMLLNVDRYPLPSGATPELKPLQ